MGELYGCEICGRSYRHLASLRNHKKFECQRERQFSCTLCHYKAKFKHHLKRHTLVKHFYQSNF